MKKFGFMAMAAFMMVACQNNENAYTISGTYDACMHQNLDDLALGRYFAVVKTAEGQYLALGRLTGLEASAATLAGGQDQNGITVTLSANVAESAMPLSASVIEIVKG